VGVILCATGIGGFWADLAPMMHTKARYWSGSWLGLFHFGSFALLGAAAGFAWQKKSEQGNFRIQSSGRAPFVEPEPDSQILLQQGLGKWGLAIAAFLLLVSFSLPTFHWSILGSALVLLAIHRNYARWQIATHGRFYLVHTFFSLQWFEDLKVLRPSRHSGPAIKDLQSVPFRRAQSFASVGQRSDEAAYQHRRTQARRIASGVYLVACLIVFGFYWSMPFVHHAISVNVALIAYAMLPWFFVSQSVAYSSLPSGVKNGMLQSPQPVRESNLLIEIRKPGWTVVGCVATGGCLAMFGSVIMMLLAVPLLPIMALLERVPALNPVPILLPWGILVLSLLNRPKRARWFELDLHDLTLIEHELVREYQFSKPKSERAVALGISPLTTAVNNSAFFPVVYLSNGEVVPLAAVGVAKEVAEQRARELARRLFLPLVPLEVGQSQAQGWIRAGVLSDKVVATWPEVKVQNKGPIDERPPLD